ncbi:MAG: hypothetical protein ATN33_00455 [Epulopiscium sp. Nele67-Bin001]|nr:MAG: hypothetical protein BEN18_03775 [Epulopiscium sp. Nuni2H_MBin001]OON93435.1 MAG: hypothetical protein ATN33_00455 [Epulopiscium sp. Nele67-Bin001]
MNRAVFSVVYWIVLIFAVIYSNNGPMKNNIGIRLFLVLWTAGFYAFYWVYSITETAIKFDPMEWETGGLTVVLLGMFTCGLYFVYWGFQMGRLFGIATNNKEKCFLHLLLWLGGYVSGFTSWIVAVCLLQNDINKLSNRKPQMSSANNNDDDNWWD